MITLKKVRVINWSGFVDFTAPLGNLTMITGENGSGKSALLDAVKYALFGDYEFNKSTETGGSRTLKSYTRGMLDVSSGTYLRKGTVYTHIGIECYDSLKSSPFVLGMVIETNTSDDLQGYRYVFNGYGLDDIDFTHEQNGNIYPFSKSELGKKYNLIYEDYNRGREHFAQKLGLTHLNSSQISVFVRKLRGVMNYDPKVKIEQFIKNNLLEEKKIDIRKLAEAKKNVSDLSDDLAAVEAETARLKDILEAYVKAEEKVTVLKRDDIVRILDGADSLSEKISASKAQKDSSERTAENLESEISELEKEKKEAEEEYIQAKASLGDKDAEISAVMKKIEKLKEKEEEIRKQKEKLAAFQIRVNEVLDRYAEDTVDRDVLRELCGGKYSFEEKDKAVEKLKDSVNTLLLDVSTERADRIREKKELEKDLSVQYEIERKCAKNENSFDQIPDWKRLRDRINEAFTREGLPECAKLACEYVISVRDEKWRDSLEAFLGHRKYTVLVPPEYYDIADEVFNRYRNEFRNAHLFNTALLMKKNPVVEENSVVKMLEIKNAVAQKYFDYCLGRMHMAEPENIRLYENAVTQSGRVSVSMDNYYLKFVPGVYYLGQESIRINRENAKKEIEKIREKVNNLSNEISEAEKKISGLRSFLNSIKEFDYDAVEKYKNIKVEIESQEAELNTLIEKRNSDADFIELNNRIDRLKKEQKNIETRIRKDRDRISGCRVEILRSGELIQKYEEDLEKYCKDLRTQENNNPALFRETKDEYEKFKSGEKKSGGPLADSTRNRYKADRDREIDRLKKLQHDYGFNYPGRLMPEGLQGYEKYRERLSRVELNDIEEIKNKIQDQKAQYEKIFKNEFVFSILSCCEQAMNYIAQINKVLKNLNFASKYEFVVSELHEDDDSRYYKIIKYANYLKSKKQLGSNYSEDQMVLFPTESTDDEEELKKDIQEIIDGILGSDNEEEIDRFTDYRNYMTYDVLITNDYLKRAKLSKQIGYNSGAEAQIPYLLILLSALLIIYNQKPNSARIVFFDEPFTKMDPNNVRLMVDFLRDQNFQAIFCTPDKMDSIGEGCDVILPLLRVTDNDSLSFESGAVIMHEDNDNGRL